MRCCRFCDFQEALAALLGKDAPNLSPAVISRLTAEWQADYDARQKRDLSARRYVYVWADGVYLQTRMEEDAECMHQAPALLGSQDRQPAEQGRSRGPGQHEGRPSRDLHRADPLLLNPLRSRRALYYSCSARKVSQLPTLPAFKPVMNQRERCAEVPWVNASGTT